MKPAADASPYHRYLKPGALARLRDSKISARSPKLPESLSHMARSPAQAQPSAAAAMDRAPHFVTYSFGPRHLRRKKLVANRSVNLPGLERGSSETLVNLLGGDAVAAH